MATRLTPLAVASTAALTLCVLPAAPAHAGGTTVGGRVLTWAGTGLAGTTVTARYTRGPGGEITVQTTTDGGGWFGFPAGEDTTWTFSVPNGNQTVLATAQVTSKPVAGIILQLNDAPGAPTGVAAAADTPTTATVTWTAPTSDGGTPVHGYRVEAFAPNAASADCETPTTVTTCTLGGLAPGQTYSVAVMARNNVGWGKRATAWVTTPTPPPAPQTPPAVPDNPAVPNPGSTPATPTGAPASSSKPTRAGRTKGKIAPTVRLSAGRHQPRQNRITVRWTSRNSPKVTLTWRRGHGRAHSQTTAPSGRITLAGPDGTRYRVTVKAGKASAHKTYRIK